MRTELEVEHGGVPLFSGVILYAEEGDEYAFEVALRPIPADNQRIIYAPKHLPLRITIASEVGVIDECKDVLVKHKERYVCRHALKVKHSWFVSSPIISVGFVYDGSDPVLVEEYFFRRLVGELWRRAKTRKYVTLAPASTIIRLIDRKAIKGGEKREKR